VAQSLHLVASGGRIVLAAVKGFGAIPEFVSDLVVVKEITIRGAFGVTSAGYAAAIRLIESGRVPALARMHTHDFPLSQVEHAIRVLAGEVEGETSIHSSIVPGLGEGGHDRRGVREPRGRRLRFDSAPKRGTASVDGHVGAS